MNASPSPACSRLRHRPAGDGATRPHRDDRCRSRPGRHRHRHPRDRAEARAEVVWRSWWRTSGRGRHGQRQCVSKEADGYAFLMGNIARGRSTSPPRQRMAYNPDGVRRDARGELPRRFSPSRHAKNAPRDRAAKARHKVTTRLPYGGSSPHGRSLRRLPAPTCCVHKGGGHNHRPHRGRRRLVPNHLRAAALRAAPRAHRGERKRSPASACRPPDEAGSRASTPAPGSASSPPRARRRMSSRRSRATCARCSHSRKCATRSCSRERHRWAARRRSSRN